VHVAFVTLFPTFFDGPLSLSIPARATAAGAFTWSAHNPRDHAANRHRTVDDTPYGGGAGMVMRAPELAAATAEAKCRARGGPVLLLSPQGQRLDQRLCHQLARSHGFVLVCGRYEGIDERFIERYVDAEVSLGDFILSGGEPAALALVDAVVRLLPGAVGNEASLCSESFESPRLEYPHFTRPPEFEGLPVPSVLTSGDHARIERWRRKVGLRRTIERRPDLWQASPPSRDEEKLLADPRVVVEPWLTEPRSLHVDHDPSRPGPLHFRPGAPPDHEAGLPGPATADEEPRERPQRPQRPRATGDE
jgi:tRNA (guanine37-N1)-methyltransferase